MTVTVKHNEVMARHAKAMVKHNEGVGHGIAMVR